MAQQRSELNGTVNLPNQADRPLRATKYLTIFIQFVTISTTNISITDIFYLFEGGDRCGRPYFVD
jgi:hypothetical protein